MADASSTGPSDPAGLAAGDADSAAAGLATGEAGTAAGLDAGDADTVGAGPAVGDPDTAAAGVGDVESGVVHATSANRSGISTKRRISLLEWELECAAARRGTPARVE